MSETMDTQLVIIPTYNESETIQAMLDTVLNLELKFDVLIVDDNSPDGTAKIVEENIPKHHNRLHILNRSEKEGLGAAYFAGFRWALEKNYGYIFEMDCDFSHPPKDLIRLSHELTTGECDLVIGSRYITGCNVVNWPMKRLLLSYFASIYVRIITGMPIHDSTAGFVGYTRKALESFNLSKSPFKGYAFQIGMKFLAWKRGFTLKEIPIIFYNRELGESKMKGAIVLEAIWGVWMLRIRSIFGFI